MDKKELIMRHFQMNFGVSAPSNTSEEMIDSFQNEFVDLVENYSFTCGGGIIEVDEHGRRLDGFKTEEEKLAIFEQVNSAETFQELANIIRSLADEEGLIQGRTRKFKAEKMAHYCEQFGNGYTLANTLTREYGIRQQALYIEYYTPNKSLEG